MSQFKFLFVFAFVFALAMVSNVEAAARVEREVEAPQEENQLGKVQEQLMSAFDSFKKSIEEIASKINTEEIAQGFQSLTTKLEDYAKKAADQFATSASNANTEPKPEEAAAAAAPAP